MDAAEKMTRHRGIDYPDRVYPKKDTISAEPLENHINCETNEKILG